MHSIPCCAQVHVLSYHVLRSREKNIDSCLNVLSRGLEQNRSSSELWQYYLKVYSQRSDTKQLLPLCKQALKYAPNYQLHCKVGLDLTATSIDCIGCDCIAAVNVCIIIFQYLRLLDKYEEREGHCVAMLTWLLNEETLGEVQCSHWILETLLYQVALATNCGR